jgi:hypothetical protein
MPAARLETPHWRCHTVRRVSGVRQSCPWLGAARYSWSSWPCPQNAPFNKVCQSLPMTELCSRCSMMCFAQHVRVLSTSTKPARAAKAVQPPTPAGMASKPENGLEAREKMVGATGFEPATSWSQTKCSSQAELRSDCGAQYPIKARLRNGKVSRTGLSTGRIAV